MASITINGTTFYGAKEMLWPGGVRSCKQCGAAMNPVEAMLGPVCGKCCKANHKRAAG